jgi:hypothetical protein
MSSSNRLILPIILSALAILAGCSSSSNTATPPPTGKFSASNLNGSYAFSAIGTSAAGAPFSLAGSLQANGNGSITGGTVDLNDASSTAPLSAIAITGGSYTVTADGRGRATLNAGQASIILDFVLLNNSHALVTRYDGSGTGSGSMDLQSTITQSQIAGSYAFTFGGIDSKGNPFATVGSFTLDSAGSISSGVEDFNDAGVAYPGLTLTGSVILGTGTAPGTATLTTNSSSAIPGTLTFDVYPVDATRLKFVENDTAALLGGDAFTQKGASLPSASTAFAFTMAGGINAPLSVGGLMTLDGVSTVSGGSEDINDNGNVPSAPQNFSGSYVASGTVGGRTLLTLTAFAGATQFVAYPTASAGLQLLELDNGGLLAGAALAQTAGATLVTSQGYGLGLAAININIGGISGAFEEDDIAEFSTTGSAFSGLIDVNDQGTLTFDHAFTGNLTLDSPATGRGVLTSNIFNGVFYAVDSSNVLLLETDTNQVGTGTLQLQTPGSQSSVAAARMTVLHLTPAARKAWRSK